LNRSSGPFAVRYTDSARDDLLRLFDFLLSRARSAEDFDLAQQAIDALASEIEGKLSRHPFIFRKAGQSPFLRELVLPFGASGYVALYEIDDATSVTILALRHQREEDYL
jgi:plasmid stabilization system protein ParE